MKDWRATEVARRLGLAVPIVQGPFGSGLSAIDLVVGVSESGGLGSFGVHHLDARGIADVAAGIRRRTGRPFALNLWIPHEDADDPRLADAQFADALGLLRPRFEELGIPLPARPARFMPRYAEQVEAVLEARPAVFSFVYGVPDAGTLSACRDRGIVTLGAATTPEEALRLEQAGVDMIVATGFEAGGHRVSFLRPAHDCLTGTMALVPQVVDAVKVPVIAAGGIADGRGIAAALCLGAQAVQIGTAFLACEESAAHPLHKARLRSPDARHTMLTRAFTGRLARGIASQFMRDMGGQEGRFAQYPVQAWLTGRMSAAAMAQGRSDLSACWAGQGAPLLRHTRAGSLMAALASQAEAILTG